MNNISFEQLTDWICKIKSALIVGHRNPDGDCVGSCVALVRILKALGAEAVCTFSEPVPERLKFIVGDGEYADFSPSLCEGKTVICADVASTFQLGSIGGELCDKIKMKIDHHDIGEDFAEREYVMPRAAATGEIIFDIASALEKAGKIAFDGKIAHAVYSAISSDTGCFKYSNVTRGTHLRAAVLVDKKIDCADINLRLFNTKTYAELTAEKLAIEGLRTFDDGKIALIAFPHEEIEKYGLVPDDFEAVIDIARSVMGALVAVSIKETEPNVYRVSMRGNGGTNVAEICEHFGGGGHICAAGCTIKAQSIDEAIDLIIERCKNRGK